MLLAVVVGAAIVAGLPESHAVLEPTWEFCVDCCSLYCAAAPTLKISDHLSPRSGNAYGATELEDGRTDTAWVVRRGPGAWFEFAFEPAGFHPGLPPNNTRTGVDRLYVSNGYNKSPRHWREHARIRQLLLAVDGRDVAMISLLDDQRPQRVDLPRTLLHRGITFRFTIVTTCKGDRFDETAVSEVHIDGYGHH